MHNSVYNLMRLVILITILIACAIPAEADSGLRAAVDKIRLENDIAGVGLLIVDGSGLITAQALGVSDHERQEPMRLDDYVRLGSVSKMFLGMTALRLRGSGLLDIDAPLHSFLEEVPVTNTFADTYVTVAQLIEHSAGLSDMSRKEWDFNEPVSLQASLAVDPASRTTRWQPGLHSSYTNSGAGVAAYAIEITAGETFETLAEQLVFAPMGLESATYFRTDTVKTSLITGYDSDRTTKIPYWHTLYRAFGGLNIRTIEMARVLQMLINRGKIEGRQLFTPAEIARLATPVTTLAARSGLPWGYGLGLYHYAHKGFVFIGHGGDADGYLTYLAYSPQLARGYFVVINAFNNRALRRIRRVIEDDLVKGFVPPRPPPVITLSREQISSVSGVYQPVTYRFAGRKPKELRITAERGRLMTEIGETSRVLLPVTANHFRRRGEPEATTAIIQHGAATYFQGDEGNFIRSGPLPE